MRQNSGPQSAEKHVKEIRRRTRRKFSAEEKIRIVLAGLRGEASIAELCRREGIAESLYYSWSKEFLEAGKKRLSGDTARQATSSEVVSLKREARDLKEVLAETHRFSDQIGRERTQIAINTWGDSVWARGAAALALSAVTDDLATSLRGETQAGT